MTPNSEIVPLRILTFSTLYPNAAQPNHGVFVENRLRHLLATYPVQATVVAPVPWFPSENRRFGHWAELAKAPAREVRHGIRIEHPRFAVVPRVGMHIAPLLMWTGVRRAVQELLRREGGVDLIDAHYFYPDGVAAALLARELELPFTITARGTDINLIPRYPVARRMILWAAARASGLITVCEALRQELLAMGVPPAKVRTLRNGVDLGLFRPLPRDDVRARLGLSGTVLLSVGGLITRKRHDLIIRTLPLLPDAVLLIAGEGPERDALARLARELGVEARVRFLGGVPHRELPAIYAAADVLVLASTREGWANVLLEAMACGTPVIATDVWGAPEVVAAPAAGRLLKLATPEGLAACVGELTSRPPARAETRRYAESFGWDATSEGQMTLFREIVGGSAAPARAAA